MAEVSVTIRTSTGMSIQATGTVDDSTVCEVANTLAGLIAEQATAATTPTPATPPA